jgi:outer membrane protein assembly factor BamA
MFPKAQIIFILFAVIALISCKSTRRLKSGQSLLIKNIVVFNDSKTSVSASEISVLIKQQPNRKIFGKIPINLFVHNAVNPKKLQKSIEKKERKKEKADLKRQLKIEQLDKEIKYWESEYNKLPDEPEYKKHKRKASNKVYNKRFEKQTLEDKIEKNKKTFREWMAYTAGEPPVILDSAKVKSSAEQIEIYLFKKGYFNVSVRDSIHTDTNSQKSKVWYYITLSKPYIINNISLNIEDKSLERQVKISMKESLLKQGEKFDFTVMDEERTRINNFLRNRGYFSFNKEFIYFDVDTTIGNKKVDIKLGIKSFAKNTQVNEVDTMVVIPHNRYTLKNIYINTDYNIALSNTESEIAKKIIKNYDTIIVYDNENTPTYYIYNKYSKNNIKPKTLLNSNYIKSGRIYRAKEVEATYRRLNALGTYSNIRINYTAIEDTINKENYLDCNINLTPLKRRTYSIEGKGTNRSGNLGISGNISWKNRNLFHGAEIFKFSASGGLEVQQLLANTGESVVGETGISPLKTFNTIEFGPELSLLFPKFISPFKTEKIDKYQSPRTSVNISFNVQKRPDFTRIVQDLNYAYEWRVRDKDDLFDKYTHFLSPLQISTVKIDKSPEFAAKLEASNDRLLKLGYRDHLIIGPQYALTYNSSKVSSKENRIYFRWNIEQAGNTLFLLYNLAKAPQDSLGSYEIFKIRFAHYIRSDFDFRYSIVFNKSSEIVFRTAAGAGIPLRNLNEALPYEKSFFAGGANGMRGWKARTLGPGSFRDSLLVFDKFGDMWLEGNMEYRFDVIKVIEGALFVDAGNIWVMKPNPARPGGTISTNFYNEIAFDAGIGIRIDLYFFIFRFDFAVPIKDPALDVGERWFFQPKDKINQYYLEYAQRNPGAIYKPYSVLGRLNLNIGIGYPF